MFTDWCILGDSGEKNIKAQKARGTVSGPMNFPDDHQMLYRPGDEKPNSTAPGLRTVSQDPRAPSTVATKSDATNFFPRVVRGNGQSRLTIDLDLSGHKPLIVGAVQQFVSDCNCKFNKDHGENFATNTQQGQAVMAFLNSLPTNDTNLKEMENFLRNHQTMENDPRMNSLPVLYVRAKLWDGMTEAISDFFGGRDEIPRRTADEVALTRALLAYANSLDDTPAQNKIELFANGTNDALDQSYDEHFGGLSFR